MKFPGLVLFIAALVNVSNASGADVVIEIQTRASMTGLHARVDLDILNKGNAPAFNVRANLIIQPKTPDFGAVPQLSPGGLHRAYVDLDLPAELAGGNFYLPVIITYDDSQQSNISTTSLVHFRYQPDSDKLFALVPEEIDLDGGCQDTSVRVQNLLKSKTALSVRLVTAPGITVLPQNRMASLPADKSVDLKFELCNKLDKLTGQYPLYAIASTKYQGLLMEEAVLSRVNIKKTSLPTRFFQDQRVVGGLVLLSFIYLCLSWLKVIFRPARAAKQRRHH